MDVMMDVYLKISQKTWQKKDWPYFQHRPTCFSLLYYTILVILYHILLHSRTLGRRLLYV